MAVAYLRFTTLFAISRVGRFSNLLDEAIGESYLALCFAVLDHGKDKRNFEHHLRTKVKGVVGAVIRSSRPAGYRRNRLSKPEDAPKIFGSESYDFQYYPGSYWDMELEH